MLEAVGQLSEGGDGLGGGFLPGVGGESRMMSKAWSWRAAASAAGQAGEPLAEPLLLLAELSQVAES